MAETLDSDVPMPLTSEDGVNGGGDAAPDALPPNPTSSPSSPSPSSSSASDSDDSYSEAQQNLQLQTLEAELSDNPSNYDAHAQYISCLRKQGELEKLRQAREAMSELFPLTPAMWQEWAKDEASLASSRPEAYDAIEKLYERGVFDYLSVSLWYDYLNFVQEYDLSVRERSSDGIVKARNLFERAVTAVGLHLIEGSKIWEAYRKFELAIFHTIDETDVEAREKQDQRIRSIFHRQLSIPTVEIESTLSAYKAWEVEQGNVLNLNSENLDGLAPQVVSAYEKALEMYNARAHFEECIAGKVLSEADKLQQYMTYIKYEESLGDPARVQILYERAITEFSIASEIWLNYTRYMDRTLKVGKIVRDVYSRAIRNCPWVGELWVRYLLSLERNRAAEKELSDVFMKSLECTFTSLDEHLDLFLTRIDGLRRRITALGEMKEALDFALIRNTFQHASDYLSQHLQNTNSLLHLYAYWARLELDLGKDLAAARAVWECLIKTSGSMLDAWKGYIEMELNLGHINEARSIYRRCYSKRFIGTGSEEICQSWLCFEREYGTLEDFDHAVRKVTPRLDELRLFRLQQESKGIAASADQKGHSLKKNAHHKRKPDSSLTDEQPVVKRKKSDSQNLKDVGGKVNPPAQHTVQTHEVEEIGAKDDKADSDSGQKVKDVRPGKAKSYSDKCTAFLSNLSLQAKYDHVQNFFSDVGGVVAVRILNDKFTRKSRGLAYVDFCDDEHLAAAVAKNKTVLLGKRVSIARSDPSQRRNKGSAGRSASLEQGDSHGGRKSHPKPQASSSATPGQGKDDFQLKGKNTFAVPRAIAPLGWDRNKPRKEDADDDKPKSNDEFRNLLLKK